MRATDERKHCCSNLKNIKMKECSERWRKIISFQAITIKAGAAEAVSLINWHSGHLRNLLTIRPCKNWLLVSLCYWFKVLTVIWNYFLVPGKEAFEFSDISENIMFLKTHHFINVRYCYNNNNSDQHYQQSIYIFNIYLLYIYLIYIYLYLFILLENWLTLAYIEI